MMIVDDRMGVAPVAPVARRMSYSPGSQGLFGVQETLGGDTGVMLMYGVSSLVLSSVIYGLLADKKAGSVRSILGMSALAAGTVIGGAMTIGAGVKAGMSS